MLHPSYTDLMRIVNSESGEDTPVVNSRYSIVMATAKRARQIIAGEANVTAKEAAKPLSTAVQELADGRLRILPDLEDDEKEEEIDFSEVTGEIGRQDDEAPAREQTSGITQEKPETGAEKDTDSSETDAEPGE